jgi:cytochrome c-type biogenesis protein
VTGGSGIGFATAFAAGVISFLSPCVLPLVPAYVSFVAGDALHDREMSPDLDTRMSALVMSALFVLGFSAVFIALGASATAIGSLLLRYRYETNLVGGTIVIVFGLLLVGLTRRLPWLARDLRFRPKVGGGRPLSACVLGVAFGFGWTPCIGPVLGAILTVSATQTGVNGVGLLSVYAAGLGVPFLLAAFSAGALVDRLKSLRQFGRWLQMAAGAIMIVMGVAMVTGKFTAFGYWLLEQFPVLGRIG